MPLLKERYTSKDYWALPEGCRSELIDGQLYDIAPPSRIHQEIVFGILYLLKKHIESKRAAVRSIPLHLQLIWTLMIKTGWNRIFPSSVIPTS